MTNCAYRETARLEAVASTVEAANGRLPVMAGVLYPGFAEAAQAGESFRKAGHWSFDWK